MNQKMKLGIADDDKDFLDALVAYFHKQPDVEVVFTAENGLKALEEMEKQPVDIVLLDLVMPYLDGIGVLETMSEKKMKQFPHIIVLGSMGQDMMIQMAYTMGAEYYLLKPFKIETLLNRIRMIMKSQEEKRCSLSKRAGMDKNILAKNAGEEQNLEVEISRVLRSLGVPIHIRGYRILHEAIYMTIVDEQVINNMTKVLYPTLAEKHEMTAYAVEKNIRFAITTAMKNGSPELIEYLFKYTLKEKQKKPTNSEFIAAVADCIVLEQKVC